MESKENICISETLFHLKENDTYEIFNVEYKSEDLINMLREKELI